MEFKIKPLILAITLLSSPLAYADRYSDNTSNEESSSQCLSDPECMKEVRRYENEKRQRAEKSAQEWRDNPIEKGLNTFFWIAIIGGVIYFFYKQGN